MPAWLSREAKAKWRRIVPELDRLGLLSVVDEPILTAFFDTAGKREQVARTIQRDGEKASPRNGGSGSVKHPLWPVLGALTSQLTALGRELGCTPAMRARLTIPEIEDDDDDVLD